MKLHTLKIEKQYYYKVMSEVKKAELRKNDRNFKVNDLIIFVDTNGEIFDNCLPTIFRITDICEYQDALKEDYVMLSIEHCYNSNERLSWKDK